MAEPGVTELGQAVANFISPETRGVDAQTERSQAIQLRQQLVETVLEKGLIVRSDQRVSKSSFIERYVVPPNVQSALANDPKYKDPFGIDTIQVRTDGFGGDLIEVRKWDYINNRPGRGVIFSIGNHHVGGGPKLHEVSILPEAGQGSEQHYYLREDRETRTPPSDVNFTAIQPEVTEMWRALRRLPDTFRPSVRQRVANRIAPTPSR